MRYNYSVTCILEGMGIVTNGSLSRQSNLKWFVKETDNKEDEHYV